MDNPFTDEEDSTNRLERLPPGAEQANDQESIRTALAVTRRVQRANQTSGRAESAGSERWWSLSANIRQQEALALLAWATQANLLLDADDFTNRWMAYGKVEGGEHQIFQENGYFYKRNNLAFHTSYFEYFERLIMHNWLFPDTLYWFEGFMLVSEDPDDEPQLRPVVTQKALLAVRGANRDEVEAEMNRMGFLRRYEDNYVNPDQTIFIEDLHDQNVLMDSTGDLLIFDPVIYLAASLS